MKLSIVVYVGSSSDPFGSSHVEVFYLFFNYFLIIFYFILFPFFVLIIFLILFFVQSAQGHGM